MVRTNYFTALTVLMAVAAAATVAVLVGAKPAQAAFPGSTGAIAFHSLDDGGYQQIYRMNADGFGPTPLTGTTADNYQPAWSADGQKIAFVSQRDGGWEIYVMNADGSNETRLTNNFDDDFGPAWFPDEPDGTRKIAFMHFGSDNSGNYNYDIYVLTIDANGQPSGQPVQLTTSNVDDTGPAVSPDGSKIAFVSDRDGDGNYDIYVMKAAPESDTNRPVRLTKSGENNRNPDWSPDGKQLAFESDRTGDIEVFRMKARPESARNRPVNLTKNDTASDGNPVWSPDARKIAFESSRSGSGDIYRMRATDGSNPVQLTTSSGQDFDPSWQPLP